MSEQNNYAEHYDATQAKGLCSSGCGRKVHKYKVKLNNGKDYTGESLWCLECLIKDGEIIDAREIVV